MRMENMATADFILFFHSLLFIRLAIINASTRTLVRSFLSLWLEHSSILAET